MRSKIYILMICLISCVGCTTFKANMLNVESRPIQPRIHNLDVVNDENSLNLVLNPVIAAKKIDEVLLKNELEENVLINEQKSYGQIEMICSSADVKSPMVYPLLSGFSLYTLNLLGMPISQSSIDVEYQFVIYDVNRKEIAKYIFPAEDKASVGFYGGRDGSELLADIMKDIMLQLKVSIQRDAERINSELEAAIGYEEDEEVEIYLGNELESTVIRWYVASAPMGADVYWRVVSSTPEVKNTNQNYLGSTPYESTESFDIKGLTYENSGNVQIEISCEKSGYITQRKRFNVRQAIDQKEISTKMNLIKD